jgi:AcrR family transcriptional regulator
VGGDGSGMSPRDHLVAVLERLLAEQGPEELTTRRIAREAGVAHGLLYNHFANKEDLILAGLVTRASALFDEFHQACPSPGSGTVEGNLAKFAAALLQLQRRLLPLLAGLIGKPALLRRFLAELHAPGIGGADRILRTVDDYLAAEQHLGRIGGAVDPHLVGVLLFAITQLQALATHVQQPEATAAEATRELRPFVGFLAASLTSVESK